jgi:hypothetical protein
MASDFGRGIKFGMGCALGAGFILLLLLFGLSMCAGEFQRRLIEQMKEQLEELRPRESPPDPEGDPVHFRSQHEPMDLPSVANSRSEYARGGGSRERDKNGSHP